MNRIESAVEFPFVVDLGQSIDPEIGADLDPVFLKQFCIVPVRWCSPELVQVAVADASATYPIDLLEAHLNVPLRIVVSTREEIERIVQERTRRRIAVARLTATDEATDRAARIESIEMMDTHSGDPAAVQRVNAMIIEASEQNASDIHLEPDSSGLRARYRIDGLLRDVTHFPIEFRDIIVQRIKIMARMDIAQRLRPQDGAMQVAVGGDALDIRVSSVPTPLGERLVLRLLGHALEQATIERLGMPEPMIQRLDQALKQPNGLIIAAGPTGSGKTTSLYACLRRIDTVTRNTITIEDPVEYHIPGVSQLQAGGDRQLTFASGLRSLLRQDPDVIMVGEIRDSETAGIALRAALTGHLILTTLHTSDPATAIVRLLDLCGDPALIAETFQLVFDQRLVRLRCPVCQGKPHEPVCLTCGGTGFRGRTGLFRMFSADESFRAMIRSGRHSDIRQCVADACGSDLDVQSRALVDSGRTSWDEIRRVLEESPE